MLVEYVQSLDEIVMQNMIHEANRQLFQDQMARMNAPQEETNVNINNDNGGIISPTQ